jgi:flavoprotein
MSEVLNAADAAERRPPDHHNCDHCGGMVRPMPILDSRKGKNFRLFRCLGCGKIWSRSFLTD